LRKKPWSTISDQSISDWGQAALAINPGKWKHGETEHFIIHFNRNGEMIARRCENFYTEIKEFFGNRKDRMENHKSQVFAFYESSDWNKFIAATGLHQFAGVTRGSEFFTCRLTKMDNSTRAAEFRRMK
jgi:hypothetical protein